MGPMNGWMSRRHTDLFEMPFQLFGGHGAEPLEGLVVAVGRLWPVDELQLGQRHGRVARGVHLADL
jgi:hypothetical protein